MVPSWAGRMNFEQSQAVIDRAVQNAGDELESDARCAEKHRAVAYFHTPDSIETGPTSEFLQAGLDQSISGHDRVPDPLRRSYGGPALAIHHCMAYVRPSEAAPQTDEVCGAALGAQASRPQRTHDCPCWQDAAYSQGCLAQNLAQLQRLWPLKESSERLSVSRVTVIREVRRSDVAKPGLLRARGMWNRKIESLRTRWYGCSMHSGVSLVRKSSSVSGNGRRRNTRCGNGNRDMETGALRCAVWTSR